MTQGTAMLAFRQALVTALRARASLADVQVLYAPDDFESGDDHLQDEAIWFGDTEWVESVIPTMKAGVKHVDETFLMEFFLQVVKADGSTQETADIRAKALIAEVQQELATNPDLTYPTILWAEMHLKKHHILQVNPGPGHGSKFDGDIEVHARLSA